MSRSRKRRPIKKKTWIWKLISLAAALYLVAVGAVWLFDLKLWDESGPMESGEPQTATIQLFFSNSERDPESLDCSAVFPVSRRLVSVPSIAREALTELLKGPTQNEIGQGYYSSINEGVEILGLDVSNGIATVSFDRKFADSVAGSCQVEAIRAQITRTLTQFPSIGEVVITVAGEASDAFQP